LGEIYNFLFQYQSICLLNQWQATIYTGSSVISFLPVVVAVAVHLPFSSVFPAHSM